MRNICEDENGVHTCVSSIKLVSLRVHCDRRVEAEVEMDHVIIASKADHVSGGNSFTGSAVSSCDSAVGISSEDEPSASSSGCGLFTCFGSCSLNLVTHPAMASTRAGQRKWRRRPLPATNLRGTKVASLSRTTFMNHAQDYDHSSDEDPTSPVLTCIGQIQVKPVKHMKAAEKGEKGREQASSQERRLQRSSRVVADVVPETPPKHFQWKQFLGSKATVNSSTVATVRDEFEFDLGRFSKTDSVAKTTQSLVESEVQPETNGSFQVTKSLLLLRLDHQDNQSQEALHGASGSVIMCDKDSQRIVLTKRASEEPLWKRRHGQKPLTLTLRKESSSAPATLEGSK